MKKFRQYYWMARQDGYPIYNSIFHTKSDVIKFMTIGCGCERNEFETEKISIVDAKKYENMKDQLNANDYCIKELEQFIKNHGLWEIYNRN